jgi:hypothetical protein
MRPPRCSEESTQVDNYIRITNDLTPLSRELPTLKRSVTYRIQQGFGMSSKNSGSCRPPRRRTCDVCKYRHQRCSGDVQSCHHCELAGLECTYSTRPARDIDVSVTRRYLTTSSGSGQTNSGRGVKRALSSR